MPRKRARQSHNKWWWAAAAAIAVVGRLAARQKVAPRNGWRGDDGAADLLRGLPPNGCDVDAAAAISLRDFETEYRGKKPLLLRGAAAHWPALEKWTRSLGREVGIVARWAAASVCWCDGWAGALALGVPWAARHRADGGRRFALPLALILV